MKFSTDMDLRVDNDAQERSNLIFMIHEFQVKLVKHLEDLILRRDLQKQNLSSSSTEEGVDEELTKSIENLEKLIRSNNVDEMDVDDLYDLFIHLVLELQKYNDLGCEVRDNREERRAARQRERDFQRGIVRYTDFLRALLDIEGVQVDMKPQDALLCVNKNEFPSLSEKAILDGLEWYISEMRFCKHLEDHNNILLALISESPECRGHSNIAEVIGWIKKKYPSLSNARQFDGLLIFM